MAKETQNTIFQTKGKEITEDIESGPQRSDAYLSLVKSACALGEWQEADGLVKLMGEDEQIMGYAWILRLWEEARRE